MKVDPRALKRAAGVFISCLCAMAIGYALSLGLNVPRSIAAIIAATFVALSWLWLRERGRTRGLRGRLHDHENREDVLRGRELCMRAVADAVPALIAYIDKDLRLQLGNQTYQRWFQRPLSEIEGKTVAELLGPRSWPLVKPYMERALRGDAVTYEEELHYPDGTRWVRVNYVPDRARDGAVRGFVALVTDIAERKRVEYAVHRTAERSRQLHQITAALSSTMMADHVARVIVEHAMVTLDADAACVGLFGQDGMLSIRGEHGCVSAAALTTGNCPSAEAARTQAPVFVLSAEERTQRYPQLASPFPDGPPHASVCMPLLIGNHMVGALELFWSKPVTFRDEDRYFLAALSRECAQAMERARLYASAQEAQAQAEASDKAKDRFIAVLSHELRTPLTPVLTAAQMLEQGAPAESNGHVRALAALIRRNVELEARLIDDLLDLTRIARGKLSLHLETVDAHAKVREVLRACETELEAKRLQVELALDSAEPHVHADQARFQQVIWNLVKNAVKFSHSGGRVTVQTSAADGHLKLEVRDEGIGIEAELLPRLFNAFEQGSREVTRHFGGLGLGLAVSKALVEAQGGSIAATSAGKNRGSTFVVTMPRAHATTSPAEARDVTNGSTMEEAHRILLVEDHEDTSEILAEFLETRGYRVKIADTVASALRIADAESFDLVLSDLGLPDGTGYDLMRQLHARHHLRGVALSGYGREKDVEEAKAAGFIEHVTKPPNPDHLLKVLSRVLV